MLRPRAMREIIRSSRGKSLKRTVRSRELDRGVEGEQGWLYYAEASCTAGRANFITGELPIRTGLTTVGQAGSPIGMPAEAPGGKGTVMEGGFRAPMILRWPGKGPAGKAENGITSGVDWFPTLGAAAGNPS